MINQDSPLKEIRHDKFGREPIVELIVDSLNQTVAQDYPCVVYGIYGRWGEGKTSLMNFVKERLLSQGKDDGISIVEFNPWLANNDDSLLREFFNSIIKGVDENTRTLFKKYGSFAIFASKTIVNAFVPGSGDALAAGIGLAKDALEDSQDTLAELKKRVSHAIVKSKKHLIIMIDDVDRLDKEELHTVFRLIRQVADFDNCIYLVAMDVDMVAKAIGDYYGNGSHQDGRKFIDKIVQVPVTIPKVSQSCMYRIILEHLTFILRDIESAELLDRITGVVAPFISTYRDLKRFCNQLSLVLPHMMGEVNLLDLCALEAIKMVNSTAYSRIYESENALRHVIGMTSLSQGPDWHEEAEKSYNQAKVWICEGMQGRLKDAVEDTIDVLFNSGTLFGEEKLDKKRLDTDVYFQKYFTQLVPEELIPDRVLDEFRQCIEEKSIEDIVDQFDGWRVRYSTSEVERASLYFIRHSVDRNEECRIASIMAKALSMSKLAKGVPPNVYVDSDSVPAFVSTGIIHSYMFVQDEHYAQMNVLDEGMLDDTLGFIFTNAEINYCMNMLCSGDSYIFGSGVYGGQSVFPLLIKRYLALGFEDQFRFSKFLLYTFLNRWRRVDSDSFNAYAKDLFLNPDHDMGRVLNMFIDGTDNAQDVANFVGLFKLQIPHINARLQSETEEVRTSRAAKLYASNYRALIES